MSDWQLIKYSLNWQDKSGFQRDCLGIALAIFGLLAWSLFLFALSGGSR